MGIIRDPECDCAKCIYFFDLKLGLDKPIGICANKKSDHSKHVLAYSHPGCNCFCLDRGYNNKEAEESSNTVLIYGGTKAQIEKQLSCDHKWYGPCVDGTSRYNKCILCFCIERDMTEDEYYEEIGLDGEGLEGLK